MTSVLNKYHRPTQIFPFAFKTDTDQNRHFHVVFRAAIKADTDQDISVSDRFYSRVKPKLYCYDRVDWLTFNEIYTHYVLRATL